MIKEELLVKGRFKNWISIIYSVINLFKIANRLHKIIIIVFLSISISLLTGSCKTCKCPAYSNIEFQKPVNKAEITV